MLYISGGTYLKLYEEFKKINNLRNTIRNKMLIGSSAGAFLLCKYSLNSFDYQPQDINKGIGLVSGNILCHWDIEENKQEKINKIKQYDPDSPIYLIKETEYIKIII